MSELVIYEEVTLKEIKYQREDNCFTYPCPCGDEFTFFVVVHSF